MSAVQILGVSKIYKGQYQSAKAIDNIFQKNWMAIIPTLFSRENIRGRHYDALSIYIRLLNFLTIAVFFNYILNSFVRT